MTPRTQVVNVKTDEYDVYIGRAMPGRAESPFANPFRIGPDGSREDVLNAYDQYLAERLAREPELAAALERLRGRRLGCWCKPLACHGDILVERLHGAAPPEPSQASLF